MKRVVVIVVVLVVLVGGVGVAAVVALSRNPTDNGVSNPITGSSAPPTPAPSTAPSTETASTPPAGVTNPPSPELGTYYSQALDWAPCTESDQKEFDCSMLTVPLDYDQPTGDTIKLKLLRVDAEQPDQRIGSLVVNPGGPGAPGTSYAAAASRVFRQPIRDRFDIVGFDPRGTGMSDPVDCLSDSELDAYIASDPDPDTATEASEFQKFADDFGQGCVDKSGDLASHVTTVEAARDMDVLRSALGEKQMYYFGASYGTKLGATYADLFPDRVGRAVLDGAVDLSISSRQLSLQQAGGFQTALDAYVDNCIATSDSCFLGSTRGEGLARIKDFINSVDAQPLQTSLGRELKVGNAFYGVILPLYDRESWPYLSQALQAAFNGDGTILLSFSDLYSSRDMSGGYSDNSSEAIFAINCLDDPYAIPTSQVPAQIPDFEQASPTFGEVFAWGLAGCEGQVAKADPSAIDDSVTAKGAAPILVVGTTRDPATPYQWAVDLAKQLDSGVLLTRDGDGHTGYNAGNECIDTTIESYLIDATVPADGKKC